MTNAQVLESKPMNVALVWLWVLTAAFAILALVLGGVGSAQFSGYEGDPEKGYVLVLASALTGLGAVLAAVAGLAVRAVRWRP